MTANENFSKSNPTCAYFEASNNSVDDNGLSSNHGWNENYDYKWDKEIYREDLASFLANISSITRDKDEWDEIDFESDDVTDILKMESEADYYRFYLKCCCCYCYEQMLLLLIANALYLVPSIKAIDKRTWRQYGFIKGKQV